MIYEVLINVLDMSRLSLLIDIRGKVSFSFSLQGSVKGREFVTVQPF